MLANCGHSLACLALQSNPEVQAFMAAQKWGDDYAKLEGYYMQQVTKGPPTLRLVVGRLPRCSNAGAAAGMARCLGMSSFTDASLQTQPGQAYLRPCPAAR